MLENEDLKQKIRDVCIITGDFLLRSGERSPVYFDKYRFESDPFLLYEICLDIIDKWDFFNIECIAGLETGGIPLSVMLSYAVSSKKIFTPSVFIRKKPKEYGTCSYIEGMDVTNKKILVIEDVITTGGQVLESCEMLESSGAHIVGIQAVLVRNNKAINRINSKYNFKYLFDFSKEV